MLKHLLRLLSMPMVHLTRKIEIIKACVLKVVLVVGCADERREGR